LRVSGGVIVIFLGELLLSKTTYLLIYEVRKIHFCSAQQVRILVAQTVQGELFSKL